MSPNQKLAELSDEIDGLIRTFRIEEARAKLGKVALSKIPAEARARWAQLARRCDDIPRALKLLAPNVFEVAHPKAEDMLEYASTIRRAGLTNQALRILKNLTNTPLVQLHRSYCHINSWQYAEAKTCLLDYLSSPNKDPYQALAAQVNLVSVHVALHELSDAAKLLAEIEPEAQKTSPYLKVGLDELNAQILFFRGETEECLNRLRAIEETHKQPSSELMLMVRKWRTLCEAKLDLSPKKAAMFRAEARQAGQFESLRHFDLYWALIAGDENLLRYVYFGTNSAAFRNLIPWQPNSPSYAWKGKDGGQRATVDSYDLRDLGLPYGLTLHRLGLILLSDFYQPWTPSRIHDSLFFDMRFDPIDSTKKVYTLASRLGQIWSKDARLSLSSTERGYRVRPAPDTTAVVHLKMIFDSQEELSSSIVAEAFGNKSFDRDRLSEILPVNQAGRARHILSLVDGGFLEKLGPNRFKLRA